MDRDAIAVLVVDDVLPIVEEMLTLLQLKDIPAVSASSLEDAVLALEEYPNISLVICDVRLGKDSGLDIVERANTSGKVAGRRIDYVFVTGDPMGIDQLPEGLDPVVLAKPVMPREFITLVNDLLGKERAA